MGEQTKKPLAKNIFIIVLFAVFVAVLIILSCKYTPYIMELLSNTKTFREYILSFGNLGAIMVTLFQFIQIVIPFIPGEVVQIAGGYIYGIFLGTGVIILGTIIGTIAAFYISRVLGYPIVKFFVKKETMDKFEFLFNSPKIETIMFILFLIPAMPKDALVYIAGLTPIKPLKFFIISLVGRLPGIIISVFIGNHILHRDYVSMIIMIGVVAVIFTLGIVFRKKILEKLHFTPTKQITTPEI